MKYHSSDELRGFSDHARMDVEEEASWQADRRPGEREREKAPSRTRISMPAIKIQNADSARFQKMTKRKSVEGGIAVLDSILATEQTASRHSLKPAQIQSLVDLRDSLEVIEEEEKQMQQQMMNHSNSSSMVGVGDDPIFSALSLAKAQSFRSFMAYDSDEDSSVEENYTLGDANGNAVSQSVVSFGSAQYHALHKYGSRVETGVNVLFAFGARPLLSHEEKKTSFLDRGSSCNISGELKKQDSNSDLRLKQIASRRVSSLLAKVQSHAPKEWYAITDRGKRERLAELLSWDSLCRWDFDVFEIDELTCGHPLLFVGWAILSSPYSQHVMEEILLGRNQERPVPFHLMKGYRFIDHFRIDQTKMTNYLRCMEREYVASNPYHNNIHAADVLQTLHSMLQQMGAVEKLQPSPLQLFSVLLSAAIHDVGHPGYNNFYQQSFRSDVALCYNDKSILENMHLALAFRKILGNKKKEAFDIFAGMTNEQVATCRRLMIGAVLGTDMSNHFQSVNDVKKRISELNGSGDEETTTTILEYMVHVADISNAAKRKHIAVNWADRCLLEFFRQGDEEKIRGLPVSPLCDRYTVSRPESQSGFIEFIVKPTFEVLVGILPSIGSEIIPILDTNLAFWNSQIPQKVVDGMEQLRDDFEKNDGVLQEVKESSSLCSSGISEGPELGMPEECGGGGIELKSYGSSSGQSFADDFIDEGTMAGEDGDGDDSSNSTWSSQLSDSEKEYEC